MTGVEIVRRLEADFRELERPFNVTFGSREDARALLFGFGGHYLQSLPEWRARVNPALLAIIESLNDPDVAYPDRTTGKGHRDG